MDVSEIITILDNNGYTDTLTADKMQIINDVVWDICAEEPWPWLEKTATFTFNGTSGTPTNYPTDVDSILAVIDTSIPRRLYPLRWETWRDNISSTAQSTTNDPLFYYFLASTFYVHPIPPSTNTTTTILYLAKQPELQSTDVEATILMPPQYHSAIAWGALSLLAAQEDDPENAALFERLYDKKMMKMRDRMYQRQMDRPDSIEIVDPEDIVDMYP